MPRCPTASVNGRGGRGCGFVGRPGGLRDRLKGSALNLGCTALAEAAGTLETLGRGGTVEGAGPLIDRLSDAFDRTAAVLQVELEAA